MTETLTLPKNEIISGKTDISALMNKGRWGVCGHLKFCYRFRIPSESGHGEVDGSEVNRIMVSVPKRNFKRAVKRNLLKRRLRESYRTQKELLSTSTPVDILFFYNTKEVLDSVIIREDVAEVMRQVSAKAE